MRPATERQVTAVTPTRVEEVLPGEMVGIETARDHGREHPLPLATVPPEGSATSAVASRSSALRPGA